MSENSVDTSIEQDEQVSDGELSGEPAEAVEHVEAPEPSQASSDAATPEEAPEPAAAPEEAAEAADESAEPAAADESAEAVADEDEDEDEDEEPDYFFQPGDWFVVHTYAGYENKVRANLSSRIQSMNMEDKIYDVVVPTEEVMELKSGKMQSVQKKVFPGYILVRMELDDDSWYVVRNTPGVTGFVGSGARPTPLEPGEVSKILAPKSEERPRPKLDYEVGEVVSVVAGPFNGYSGPVNAIDVDRQQVTVLLDLFGRETPVELTFEQVTKL